MEEYMEDYNQISTTKMKLVLFMDAIEHVCRISCILRQPLGNALLLGMGGSGRQSLTKLASFMWDLSIYLLCYHNFFTSFLFDYVLLAYPSF